MSDPTTREARDAAWQAASAAIARIRDDIEKRFEVADMVLSEARTALNKAKILNEALYGAVRYALDRGQIDPDFGYLCGPGTQLFEELCKAEAAQLGASLEEVRATRAKDLQPEHRRREPDIVVARERIRELESQLAQRR